MHPHSEVLGVTYTCPSCHGLLRSKVLPSSSLFQSQHQQFPWQQLYAMAFGLKPTEEEGFVLSDPTG